MSPDATGPASAGGGNVLLSLSVLCPAQPFPSLSLQPAPPGTWATCLNQGCSSLGAPLCLRPPLCHRCPRATQEVPGACCSLHREPKIAAEAACVTFSIPGGGGHARPVLGSPRVPVLRTWEAPAAAAPSACGAAGGTRGVAEGTGVPISSHSPPGAAVCARDRSMVLVFALRLLGSSALLLATAAGAQGKGEQWV